MTPPASVMTSDVALEYEMKLLNQAIEQSLQDQVNIYYIYIYIFAFHVSHFFQVMHFL